MNHKMTHFPDYFIFSQVMQNALKEVLGVSDETPYRRSA